MKDENSGCVETSVLTPIWKPESESVFLRMMRPLRQQAWVA